MKEKLLTLSQLCKELSISYATGRNWLRLGKITPTSTASGSALFNTSYIDTLKNEIEKGTNASLKSRRNKKYRSGFELYESYVSKSSPNIGAVSEIVNYIKDNEVEVTEDILLALLSDCAGKLIKDKYKGEKGARCQMNYIDGDKDCVAQILTAHPDLFCADYTYISTEDTLGLLYISLRSLKNRKEKGAYYTPTEVVNSLISNLFSEKDIKSKEIIDPCCGTGNFILQLPETVKSENVYANDIDEISVKLARINYALKYDISERDMVISHITQSDFLIDMEEKKYDIILGNPPWGSEVPYDAFVEKALKSLKDNGHLSFVLPESILSVKSHKKIRQFMMSSCRLKYVEFLGEAFHGVQCPSIILHAQVTKERFTTKGLVVNDGINTFTIDTDRVVSDDSLSLKITDKEYVLIKKIMDAKNKVTLKNNALFGLGIVTGNNKRFISTEKTFDNEPVLKGTDIEKFRYNVPNNFISFTPEMFQQVAPEHIYRAKEKLLYKFISSDLAFAYDDKGTLSLNSCNILIPQIPGLSIKYVMAVLNSSAAQFVYSKLFGSVKVLRSHLEQIPIPIADDRKQKEIIAYVEKIIKAKKPQKEIEKTLDKKIAELYGLTGAEYQMIKASLK
ncbi:MAG: N-6 DNA methylase [Butyrivibrio sp.]|nr:TaqI-like C-terminal specificity domain-containing protein [Butyrivibrio sp.]MBR1642746.1 N-6 DNA methylase [Butyrivibrio sp.]